MGNCRYKTFWKKKKNCEEKETERKQKGLPLENEDLINEKNPKKKKGLPLKTEDHNKNQQLIK